MRDEKDWRVTELKSYTIPVETMLVLVVPGTGNIRLAAQ